MLLLTMSQTQVAQWIHSTAFQLEQEHRSQDDVFFLQKLCKSFADHSPFEVVFVGLFDSPELPSSVTSIAGAARNGDWSKLTYSLDGTPCATLTTDDVCIFEDFVAEKFPEDKLLVGLGLRSYCGVRFRNPEGTPIGIFVGVSKNPVKKTTELMALFRSFSNRIGLKVQQIYQRDTLLQSVFPPSVHTIEHLIQQQQFEEISDRLVFGQPGERPHILCVDPEFDMVEFYKGAIEDLGYSVTATTDPLLAFNIFLQNPSRYSMLISEISMPSLSGIDLAIRLESLNPNLKILFCSEKNSQNQTAIWARIKRAQLIDKMNLTLALQTLRIQVPIASDDEAQTSS